MTRLAILLGRREETTDETRARIRSEMRAENVARIVAVAIRRDPPRSQDKTNDGP